VTPRASLLVEPASPPPAARPAEASPRLVQRTLASAIHCTGTGLHSGRRVRLAMAPADPGSGIVFRRTDTGIGIPARHDHVRDTTLCTVIGLSDDPGMRIGTIEHLMAALSAAGIDNAIVSVDGPEVPALDGSAAAFTFLIGCAGTRDQEAPLSVIEVLRPVRVEDGEAKAALLPAQPRGAAQLTLSMEIAFASAAIGHQALSVALTGDIFARAIAPARTFGFAEDLQRLRAAGLARGGSLDNAVAISGDRVLNREGLRFPDEFVRHKLLDAIGDLALAGLPIRGRFVGHRSGHRTNNALLRALFADPSAFRVVAAGSRSAARPAPVAADRAPAPDMAVAAA
jgi:UDP-3-O-[3-hydroxymyristoyl] N-acetylglucosamine deacetylase